MTTNRRAEDFEKALSANGPADPAIAGLLAVAGALAAIPQPRAAFREGLRAQLMAEATSTLAASASTAASIPAQAAGGGLRTALTQPAMQVATGTLAAVVGVTGVGIGASRSLPGDALYGLKRAVERWQVGLAGNAESEAEALIEHANTRLAEVRALLANGDLADVTATLEALKAELDSATGRLLAAARDGSRAAYDRLAEVTAEINTQLVALLPSLPAEAKAAASQAMSTLNVARAHLATIPQPPIDVPTPTITPGTPTTSVPVTTPPVSVPPTTPPVSVPVTTPPVSVPITTPPVSVPITTPPITVPPLPTELPITLPPI